MIIFAAEGFDFPGDSAFVSSQRAICDKLLLRANNL